MKKAGRAEFRKSPSEPFRGEKAQTVLIPVKEAKNASETV